MSFPLRMVVTVRARLFRRFWRGVRFPGKPLVYMAWRIFREMVRNDATHQAAGIAYYSMFSIFPLLLAILAVSGSILAVESMQADFLEFVTKNLPGSGDFVEENVGQVVRFRGVLGAVGALGLIWSAATVFGAIAKSVDRAWNIQGGRPFYISKLLHIGMSTGMGILFILSALMTSFIEVLTNPTTDLGIKGLDILLNPGLVPVALRLIPWSMTLLIFLVIYRYVPNTKTYWRNVWPGALVAAVIFEIGKSLFVFYLENAASYSLIYGSLTSAMALMLWIYLSSLVLILGAEICSESARLRGGDAGGRRGGVGALMGRPEADH